jgi:hypothetical protein
LRVGVGNGQMNVSHGDAGVIGWSELSEQDARRGREQTEPSHARYRITDGL